jgi:hypothetical protein
MRPRPDKTEVDAWARKAVTVSSPAHGNNAIAKESESASKRAIERTGRATRRIKQLARRPSTANAAVADEA